MDRPASEKKCGVPPCQIFVSLSGRMWQLCEYSYALSRCSVPKHELYKPYLLCDMREYCPRGSIVLSMWCLVHAAFKCHLKTRTQPSALPRSGRLAVRSRAARRCGLLSHRRQLVLLSTRPEPGHERRATDEWNGPVYVVSRFD
eukprot:g22030.t1